MNTINKTVISKYNEKTIVINIINDKMTGIYAFSDDELLPGTIVNSRITKNLSGIGSSFLRYAEKKEGFINKELKCDTVLPVVLKKEPSDTKKALFSDKLFIEGDYCIVRDLPENIIVSSKIPKEDAYKLKEKISEIFVNCGYEITVRTKVYSKEDGLENFKTEASHFIELLNKIKENSIHRPCGTIFYKPDSDLINAIKDGISQGVNEIVTDDLSVYNHLNDNINRIDLTEDENPSFFIRFYEDNLLPLCKLYSFDAKISEVLSRKINLKSGAYITFDTTEALTAIDVNSAKTNLNIKAKEDMFLAVNLEACREIFRQIRLRNISGNIFIDFINMNEEESYAVLKTEIEKCIKTDKINTHFYGFTKLMLAEISRQKKKNSFYHCYKG